MPGEVWLGAPGVAFSGSFVAGGSDEWKKGGRRSAYASLVDGGGVHLRMETAMILKHD